jgi:biopolymer transport protein ExbD
MLKKRRKNELICRIDVTGFLSIQVALLAMFFAPVPDLPRMIVEPPKAVHSVSRLAAEREDALILAITYDAHIYFVNQRLELGEIRHKLQDGMGSGAEREVYLNVDARSRYREVKEVLDQIRLAGIERVFFITNVSVPK